MRVVICKWLLVAAATWAMTASTSDRPLVPAVAIAVEASALCSDTAERPEDCVAVIIGVESYEHASNLPFVANDVKAFRTVLEESGVPDSQLVVVCDSDRQAKCRPRHNELRETLEGVFKQVGKDQMLIFYFSGHGKVDEQGQMYLAPADYDPKAPAETAISLTWLRAQLAQCEARHKILILDTCHAGCTKNGEEASSVSPAKLAQEIEKLGQEVKSPRLITLASCGPDEESGFYQHNSERLSLFTYWLIRAMQGHADNDFDGYVDVGEASKFVDYYVPLCAERIGLRQHPGYGRTPDVRGNPKLVRIKVRDWHNALQDMVERIAEQLAVEDVEIVPIAVAEFLPDPITRAVYGVRWPQECGTLGRFLATVFCNRLQGKLGDGKVVPFEQFEEVLAKEYHTVASLETPQRLKGITVAGKPVPACVVGSFSWWDASTVNMQCQLYDLRSGRVLAAAAAAAGYLDSRLIATLPGSDGKPRPRYAEWENPLQRAGQSQREATEAGIARPGQRRPVHPLQDPAGADRLNPSSPYQVHVLADDRPAPVRFVDGFMYVLVEPNAKLAIRLENHQRDERFFRVLVDGKAVLPQRDEQGRERPMCPVELAQARAWYFPPSKGKPVTLLIPGFFVKVGEGKDDVYRTFRASFLPPEYVAQDRGMISVGVYEAVEGTQLSRGNIGVVGGEEATTDVHIYHGSKVPGRQLMLITIHCVSPEYFEQIRQSLPKEPAS